MPPNARARTAARGPHLLPGATSGPDREEASEPGITAYGCSKHEARIFGELTHALGVHLTLTPAPVSDDTAWLASGNRCISVSHRAPLPGPALAELSRAGVEYVSTRSIGCNHVDLATAHELGIVVETVSYSPGSVADYTLMLILMLLRDARSVVSRSTGHDYRLPDEPGRELGDLTVGVVGTGRIGSAVVERLAVFGCQVLTHDRRLRRGGRHVPLDDLLERSDVVTLHVPLTHETHHLLDRRGLERMKPGAYVVNTARGALLDTGALVSALEGGRLGGAALDVLEEEDGIFYEHHRTAPPEHEALLRLHAHPNVLVTPHSAYFTDRAVRDMVVDSVTRCLDFERRSTRG